MNPITASSLISIGKNILDRVSTPIPDLPASKSASFSKELMEVTTIEKPLSCKELREEFITSPAIQSFIEKNTGDKLYLEKRADGSMQILSSNGQSLILKQGSEDCATAKIFFETCVEEQVYLSDNRANAVEIKV